MGGVGKPEPRAGSWLWRAARGIRKRQATGGPCAARPGKVPCISYMEGTLSYSARHKRLGQERHAGKHSASGRRHAWTSQRKGRAGADAAETPEDHDTRADQRFTPTQE